jgi:hypothetical protein
MSRKARQLALITRGIRRRRETRHSVAPRIHALSVNRINRHPRLRGGVLPADRLNHGCAVVCESALNQDLRYFGILPYPIDKPCKNYRWAGSQWALIGTPPQRQICEAAQYLAAVYGWSPASALKHRPVNGHRVGG